VEEGVTDGVVLSLGVGLTPPQSNFSPLKSKEPESSGTEPS
jgi:hypothetical protein